MVYGVLILSALLAAAAADELRDEVERLGGDRLHLVDLLGEEGDELGRRVLLVDVHG